MQQKAHPTEESALKLAIAGKRNWVEIQSGEAGRAQVSPKTDPPYLSHAIDLIKTTYFLETLGSGTVAAKVIQT
jgi:hypothetical protein